LSRGAREAVFVDDSATSRKNVRENLQLCSMEAKVVRSDALAYLKQCSTFDLIFVDPPYASGLYEKVLETINLFDILSEGGIIIVEADRDCALPEMAPPYHRLREYRYGKVKICTYTKESAV
ncbi:MAG: RsmD family RNA methyltransferase, partial [Oscillospiraceae bacterium]|nr:RsmD family RNA methyltransferase [Oscillospiraceae bacterium]